LSFVPRSVTLSGALSLPGAIDRVFPLFSPAGERDWVPGWDPEILWPPGVVWEEGMLFRTQEERGPAVWVVTRLDKASHAVTYHRVEAGRYVARVDVACRRLGERQTEATVRYTFVGLSETGNEDIAAMNDGAYEAKMARWKAWIEALLQRPREQV
jgi:hypothetical protein